MIEAIKQLRSARPDVQAVVVVAPSRSIKEIQEITSTNIKLVEQQTREALAASDAAAVASGTATLEAALLETPIVVVYKESPINWHTLGRLITVEHYGLVNLVAGREIAKELMQDELTGENLANELLSLRNRDTTVKHGLSGKIKQLRERVEVALNHGQQLEI